MAVTGRKMEASIKPKPAFSNSSVDFITGRVIEGMQRLRVTAAEASGKLAPDDDEADIAASMQADILVY